MPNIKRGVYFLADDGVLDMVIAFLNSLKKSNPHMALCLVPFNANIDKLREIREKYQFSIYEDQKMLRFCDEISQGIQAETKGHYRKLACWHGPFDEFVYIDVDMVILENFDFVFDFLKDFTFVTSHSDMPELVRWVWKGSIHETGKLSEEQIAYSANTGFIASHKNALSVEFIQKSMPEAINLSRHMVLYCVEQAFLNFLIVTSGKSYSSILRIAQKNSYSGHIPIEVWAGKPGGKVKEGKFTPSIDTHSKALLMHWAGQWQPHIKRVDIMFYSLCKLLGIKIKETRPLKSLMMPYRRLWEYYRYAGYDGQASGFINDIPGEISLKAREPAGDIEFPQVLPGALWGITAFFNPAGHRNMHKNYVKFRTASRRQGLKLLAIELVFGDRPFELKEGDADILIQVRGALQNIVWQKEALLNLALKKLPEDCDKVVWLDCDILFKNDDWVSQTSRLLEKYKVIQPFSWVINLKDGQDDADPLKVPFGHGDAQQFYGMAYRAAECGLECVGDPYEKNGHVGHVWACRRDLIEELAFLDKAILQNNDTLMAFAFYGSSMHFLLPVNFYLPREAYEWTQRAWELTRGSVYYCPGVILHLWHGDQKDRIYNFKRRNLFLKLMKISGFDLNKDLRKNSDGLWEWVQSSGGVFREELASYYLGKSAGKELNRK